MELFLDVLAESLVDTAKMLPFLFLAYLFIEYVETRHGERIETLLAGGGRWGAVPGAVLGCVPQCGFSAIASNFYASRVITLGTLMAVYLATSDEAIPLLVSMPAYWDKLALLMVIKVVYAIFVGFMLDFVLRKALPRSLRGGYTGRADEVDCHEEHSDEQGQPQPIWKAALRHTLEIFVFIFAFSLVFGLIVEGVGEDVFAAVLGRMGFFQPVMAALVGLVPNCAASVLLAQLYMEGAIPFGSLFAGAAPVIAAISGIIAVVSILGDHLEDIRGIVVNVFGETGGQVFDVFTGKLQGVADFVTGLFSEGGVAAALAPLQNTITNLFGENAGAAFGGVVTILQSIMGVVGQIVTFATGTVKPIIQDVFAFITGTVLPIILQTFTAAAPTIASIISNIGSAVMTGMQIIGSAIQAAMPIIQGIITVIMTIGSVVVPALLAGFEAFSAGISAVMSAIQGLSLIHISEPTRH